MTAISSYPGPRRVTARIGVILVTAIVAASGIFGLPTADAASESPCIDGTTPAPASTVTCTEPASTTLNIPAGVRTASIAVTGAGGGGSTFTNEGGAPGGNGGLVTGTVTFPTGADSITVVTGYAGTPGRLTSGGGASGVFVSTGGRQVWLIAVAGAGGGGGAITGGGGNAGDGGGGGNSSVYPGARAVGNSPGAGGSGNKANGGTGGRPRSLILVELAPGGDGGHSDSVDRYYGGEGGGGYAGGGGGGIGTSGFSVVSAGGGGGSSYTNPSYLADATVGVKYGTGGSGPGQKGSAGTAVVTFGAAPPQAPGHVTATAVAGRARVAWTAPSNDGGAVVSGYTVTANPGGATQNCSTSPCTMQPLLGKVPYSFSVTAVNVAGRSVPSDASPAIIVDAPPPPPTDVRATPGNGTATLTFVQPADGKISPVTGYLVTSSTQSREWTCSAAPCVVGGLTNGESSAFRIRARNLAGLSLLSTASNTVVPSTVPGQPTGLAATPGNGLVRLTWTAPPTGGAPIEGYRVVRSDGAFSTCSGPVTSCTVTGLRNGSTYRFTVAAYNDRGRGPDSADSNAVAPFSAPAAPTGVTAVGGDARATVSFVAPSDTGGSPITGYKVTVVDQRITVGCPASPCTVSGLVNGATYRFTVQATNAAGDSTPSGVSAPVRVATTPAAPTTITATPLNGAATVVISPGRNGGSPVTYYTITSTPDDIVVSCPSATCTVTGLRNGTAYTFTATATNAVGGSGASPASVPVTPATVPAPPENVAATAGSGQAFVSFDAPVVDGGRSIESYTVVSAAGGPSATCEASPCTISGLVNGNPYTFFVYATNAVGNSANSAATDRVIPASAPGEPGDVAVARDSAGSTVAVTWTAPDDGGLSLTGYSVSVDGGSGCVPVPATATGCSVAGLNPLGEYRVDVVASNAIGSGTPATVVLAAVVRPGAPGAVTTAPTADHDGVIVSWGASTDGGAPVTAYTVTAVPGDISCLPNPSSSLSCTVDDLPVGVAHTFSVVASNVTGNGPPTTSRPYTRVGTPSVPLDLQAVTSYRSMRLTFDAPASDGDNPILGYRVSVNGGGTWAELPSTGDYYGPFVATVNGLDPGTTYHVRVQAYNSDGYGGATVPPVSAVTRRLTGPSVPVGVEAAPTAIRGQLKLSWHKPLDDGGDPIIGYRVSLNGGGTWSAPLKVLGPAAGPYTASVEGLQSGRTYQVRMQAWNDTAYGGASPVAPATPR